MKFNRMDIIISMNITNLVRGCGDNGFVVSLTISNFMFLLLHLCK